MKLSEAHICFPKKTLAGSSFQHLAEDLDQVVIELEQARKALAKAHPHPRDYIHDGNALSIAQSQHEKHLNALDGLIDFYILKRDHCLNQL